MHPTTFQAVCTSVRCLRNLRPCLAHVEPPPLPSFAAGVICDYGLTLSDLIGVLQQFFDRLGLKKLRFKPAFNPYTEPSMEIFRFVCVGGSESSDGLPR